MKDIKKAKAAANKRALAKIAKHEDGLHALYESYRQGCSGGVTARGLVGEGTLGDAFLVAMMGFLTEEAIRRNPKISIMEAQVYAFMDGVSIGTFMSEAGLSKFALREK